MKLTYNTQKVLPRPGKKKKEMGKIWCFILRVPGHIRQNHSNTDQLSTKFLDQEGPLLDYDWIQSQCQASFLNELHIQPT